MSHTKVLSTQTIFTSKFFKVNRVEIERDGKTFEKDIIEDTPIAVILPYTKDGEIYLNSEYRDALQKTMLNCIGGKIKPGDDPLSSAKRELLEESGLTANSWKHIGTWEASPVMDKKIYVFFATDLEKGEQHLEMDEKIEVVKLSITEALQKIASGEISLSAEIAMILLFDRLRRENKL